MTKRQRRKFEMFMRVRDFFNAHTSDFPAGSVAGQLFTALSAISEQLGQLDTEKISVLGDVAQSRDVKGDAKDLLYSLLQDIADLAGSMAYEINGLEDKFRLPRNRSVSNLIAAGRAFATDAATYKTEFIEYGLDGDFIVRLTAATDALEAAYSETDTHTQERVGTIAALVPMIKDGMEKVRRLDPLVKIKYRNSAENLSAWVFASHVRREDEPPKPQPTA